MNEKLVGIEVKPGKIELAGESVVGSVVATHRGKIGGFKLTLEGDLMLLPMLDKAIDKLEEIIPGDQKFIAGTIKTLVRNIKFKL